jgi:predicted DNA-binding transcriptional regulator AlpA
MRIGRLPKVKEITGYSKSTIRRLELQGDFPRRFRLADDGWPYWDLDAVDAHIKQRAATSNEEAA